MNSTLTFDVMKSDLTRVCERKIRNGYITLETRVLLCMVAYFCHEIRDSYHDNSRELSR